MLNLISLVIGGVSLLLTLLALLPLLGWANWFILPLPVIGLVIGMLSGGSKSGRNLNLVVIIISVVRLILGGGII